MFLYSRPNSSCICKKFLGLPDGRLVFVSVKSSIFPCKKSEYEQNFTASSGDNGEADSPSLSKELNGLIRHGRPTGGRYVDSLLQESLEEVSTSQPESLRLEKLSEEELAKRLVLRNGVSELGGEETGEEKSVEPRMWVLSCEFSQL